MSAIKYRPQLTLDEINCMVEAIRHSVENGNNDPRVFSLYNRLNTFKFKCENNLNAGVLTKSGTKNVRSTSHSSPFVSSNSPNSPNSSSSSSISASNIDSHNIENTDSHNIENTDSENTQESKDTREKVKDIAAYDAEKPENVVWTKYNMLGGKTDTLTEEEIELLAVYKVNNRMEVTEEEMKLASNYMMKQLI